MKASMKKIYVTGLLVAIAGCSESNFNASQRLRAAPESDDLKQQQMQTEQSGTIDTTDLGSVPLIKDDIQPSDCTEAAKPSIDFEAVAVGGFDGSAYLTSNGVRFTKPMRVVPTTRKNDGELAKSDQAWLCILCEGRPNRNRLADAASEATVGQRVLASTSPGAEIQTLEMSFTAPVASGSFDMIDQDGSEVWDVTFFDEKGAVLEVKKLDKLKGYRISKTGNGRPMRITFERDKADIGGIRIIGSKKHGFFGFAFDNFAIKACPAVKK